MVGIREKFGVGGEQNSKFRHSFRLPMAFNSPSKFCSTVPDPSTFLTSWPALRSHSAFDFLNGFKVPYDSVEVSVVRAGGMLDVSLISSVVGDLGKDKFPRKTQDKWN